LVGHLLGGGNHKLKRERQFGESSFPYRIVFWARTTRLGSLNLQVEWNIDVQLSPLRSLKAAATKKMTGLA
jgi:hypothetical protein